MHWASAISERITLSDALDECASSIARQLDGTGPDLVVAFVSPHFTSQADRIPGAMARQFRGATVIGCSGAGIIGAGHEVEGSPALSLTAAALPGVTVTPFHVTQAALPSPDSPPDAWVRLTGVPADGLPHFVILSDPFSLNPDDLVAGLDFAYPAAAKIGGLASGGVRPGSNVLLLNGELLRQGAVGVALSGNIVVDTVVAQGCRPIGRPMRITRAEKHLLFMLDGEPALRAVQRLYDGLPPHDQALVQGNLFLGIAMDPLLEVPRPGDFLVRNVMGGDSARGAIAIGAMLREGQLVQFHVRDAETSTHDLHAVLAGYKAHRAGGPPAGALLFQCVGRGRSLYGRPDHDTDAFRELLGPMPLGGFFCNGEIGPVAGTTYLHGYTSSFGLFRPRGS